MEITSALQSEQHVKKELAKKLGQLQEKLAELKETVTPASAAEARGGGGGSGSGGRGQDPRFQPGVGGGGM